MAYTTAHTATAIEDGWTGINEEAIRSEKQIREGRPCDVCNSVQYTKRKHCFSPRKNLVDLLVPAGEIPFWLLTMNTM